MMNGSSYPNPVQKLETILRQITDPVRPCISGQYFASALPLTNKQLYEFSPKYREIHDSRMRSRRAQTELRQKQQMRHWERSKAMHERSQNFARTRDGRIYKNAAPYPP